MTYRLELCIAQQKKKNYALLSHQIQENSYKNVFFFWSKTKYY